MIISRLPNKRASTENAPGPNTILVTNIVAAKTVGVSESNKVDVEAGNGQYTATLRFVVPYVQWGMKNPSTLILRVSDKVNITVKTVAKPTGRPNNSQ